VLVGPADAADLVADTLQTAVESKSWTNVTSPRFATLPVS